MCGKHKHHNDLLTSCSKHSTAAASQDCMNCVGFFGEGGVDAEGKNLAGPAYAFGEKIARGSGAMKNQYGASGVTVHMTNMRITDPDSLKKRYPVILREFSIREERGRKDIHNGDNGCVRDIVCRAPLKFSVITKRMVVVPYGLE